MRAPRRITPLCSSASLLLRRSQTSRVRASSASTPRLPDADLGAFALRPNPRPPGSRAKSFHTCQGLRPRRAGRPLALTRPSMSPSVILTTSAPDTFKLSRAAGSGGLFDLIHHNCAPCAERTGFPFGVEHCVVVRRGAHDAPVTQPPLRLRPIRGSSWCGARIDRASGMRGRVGS